MTTMATKRRIVEFKEKTGEAKVILGSSARYTLVFSDIDFGHSELGFIPRKSEEDPDDEDMRYQKYLTKKGYKSVRVYDGYATMTNPEHPLLS
jgi:hypothetical protein